MTAGARRSVAVPMAVLVALLVAPWVAANGPGDDSPIVFPMGKERRLLVAVSPHELSVPIEGAWALSGLLIGKSSVRYQVSDGSDSAALVVQLSGRVEPDGTPAHTFSTDPQEPASAEARLSLQRLREAFAARADPDFWASVVEVSRDSASAPGRSLGARGTERWLWRVTLLLAVLGLTVGAAGTWRRRQPLIGAAVGGRSADEDQVQGR